MAEGETRKIADRWNDYRLEQFVGNLLRAGVLIAALLVIAGAIPNMIQGCTAPPHYRVFAGEPADLRSVTGIVGEAALLNSRGIMQLGLLLLIATPIARVLVSLVVFALQRDRLYVMVTAIVLGVLLYSLIGTH